MTPPSAACPSRIRTRPRAWSLVLLLGCVASAGPAAPGARAGIVRVRLQTSAGPILLALDARHAPATTANFLAYVDDGRLDGTDFYRAARSSSDPKRGFIQGGIGQDAQRMLPSFKFESTAATGLRHLDMTISMARGASPRSASGNFVIAVGAAPAMDARGSYLGYATFGRVIGGADVVRRILALPSGGGRDEMKGQMILHPVRIVHAIRIDGTAKPTGRPKVWLLGLPH